MTTPNNNKTDLSGRIIDIVYYFMLGALFIIIILPLLFLFLWMAYDTLLGVISGEIKGVETVAELTPAGLLAIIITGCMVGTYGPMFYWRELAPTWDEQPIQAKLFVWVAVAGFLAGTVGFTVLIIQPH